ncbi:ndrB, partial [Symbiodinium pilosum]
GAFGTVFLVGLKSAETPQYFALKQMTKQRHAKKNIKKCVYNERDVLAQARNRWFVELFATFQDANHIYMLMEFLPGGDLFKWIEVKNRFSVDETRFYMAELLEALDVLHKHGFIHRDIKFDNMILTSNGHLKLLDFGLCKAEPTDDRAAAPPKDVAVTHKSPSKLKSSLKQGGPSPKRQQVATQVGTVYYMAPEVMRGEVSPGSDIWAVGVMTFECLYGSPPFHAYEEDDEVKRRQVLRQMVLNHKKVFPARLAKAKRHGVITVEAESFLQGVIRDPAERLDVQACKNHAFFSGIDFARLHLMEPPFKPDLSGPTDLRNFDEHPFQPLPTADACSAMKDPSMEWANYEFDRTAYELQRPEVVKDLLSQEPGQSP